MSTTINIPGGTAELYEAKELKVRQRRAIEIAGIGLTSIIQKLPPEVRDKSPEELMNMKLEDLNISVDSEDAMKMYDLQDTVIVNLLKSWTLTDASGAPVPLPTVETIGDMDTDVYDALAKETRTVNDKIKATDFGPNPSPSSPTTPSSASNGDLRAQGPVPSSESPSTSSTDGTVTPIGSSSPA